MPRMLWSPARTARFRRPLLTALAVTVLAVGPSLAGCTGSGAKAGAPATISAADLVLRAKTVLDATTSLHFLVSSTDVPTGVTVMLGGEGDAARPDRFAGDLDVSIGGVRAKVGVISIGGTLYAKLPFAASYQVTDPAKFRIPDPGSFMSPTTGLTQLLARATDVRDAGTARAGTVVTRQVTAQIPGDVVGKILVTADPATPVKATFGIDPDTGRLRTASLVGPFFTAGTDSTYRLEVSRYDEPVTIQRPAA